jgi:hypothetical protein
VQRPPSPFSAQSTDWRDIALVTDDDLQTASGHVIDDLIAVWIRRGGIWHGTVLTGWRQLRPGYWAARIQPTLDEEVWVHHRGVSLQPVMPQVNTPPGDLTRTDR